MNMNNDLFDQIEQARLFIADKIKAKPSIGLVLGTGLSKFADGLEVLHVIPYNQIPFFPTSSVKGHQGNLVFAVHENHNIIILQGRFHYYEGYSMQKLTMPIRVLAALGIETLLLTNIAGGLNSAYELADLVVIKDHINLMPDNPLRGLNDDRYGDRFPVMLNAYDLALRESVLKIAKQNNVRMHEGVYLSLQGPSLETKAEYAFLKQIGADVVGMSTVPEVIVATQLKLKICVISCISNLASDPDNIEHAELDEIIEVAEQGSQFLGVILKELIKSI